MSTYLMTYRAHGQRCNQQLTAADAAAAWALGFELAERMGTVCGFGIALLKGR